MDDEQPHQELVKCVLVGDNAVGKTRLICARACKQKVSLSQLLNTHVPTVWAIDQYRIYKDVLENSWMVLDGVNVSLRLWDTFGDHHKDRRFAYGRSDVVLMCFDIGRVSSLENCREMWYQQIRKFCPNTPVILVGCKNDVRFILHDEQYINYCKERSPLVRQVRERDLVFPEQGRAVANELGIPYYETSVLTYYGLNEVFENAIRAALCAKRAQRFWMTNLKRVIRPTLQEPHCPPRPKLPDVLPISSVYGVDRIKLFDGQHFTDVIFLCGNVGFSAHKFILAASSPTLQRLLSIESFTSSTSDIAPTRSSSETSLVSYCLSSSPMFTGGEYFYDEETECLIPPSEHNTPSKFSLLGNSPRFRGCGGRLSGTLHKSSSSFNLPYSCLSSSPQQSNSSSYRPPETSRTLNHPAFTSLKVQQCESLNASGKVITSLQTVLTCSKIITPLSMSQALRFIYTGTLEKAFDKLDELKQAAEFLDIPDLYNFIYHTKACHYSSENGIQYLLCAQRGLEEICFIQGLFADIFFSLDDGTCSAHKPLLMARCDMMHAMFSHEDFVEKSARVIKFPGVSRFTFQELLYYLYTDRTPPHVTATNCLGILEIGNRLCLPRLISLIETAVVEKLSSTVNKGGDVTEDALKILEHCQIHNADQLSEWCLAYLAQNYNLICRKYPKVLRSLHPENQATLNVRRWPPIWYLKDFDNYQRMLSEQERDKSPKNLKRTRNNSGCLCFSAIRIGHFNDILSHVL
uniref:BTB domain-containing protein n=1 Tax=Lepeophtheirus salmonis TaxID=72036 RepID=A0A0K2VAD6_LEPSM